MENIVGAMDFSFEQAVIEPRGSGRLVRVIAVCVAISSAALTLHAVERSFDSALPNLRMASRVCDPLVRDP